MKVLHKTTLLVTKKFYQHHFIGTKPDH